MAYGLKYTVTLAGKTLEISQKNYTGSSSTITPASPAVVHSWDKDEPTAPIKGSSLTAGIVGVPLEDFYANNDDEFKGELFNGSDLLFSGFLVQDDCTEDVDDLLHPVILSFTDNLGLLKDVDLGTALAAISSTGSKISLLEIIQACLVATGVVLPLEIFSALKEDNQDTASTFLNQTLIAKESFLKSEREYDNCYNVLEEILTAMQATLVQSEGQWNIIRWHEHTPTSYKYNSSFALTGTGVYNNFKVFGRNEAIFPEAGYHKGIVRPYNVVKETFDYKLPHQILKNADLKDLGSLRTTYTSGSNTVKEYDFSDWFDSPLAGTTSTFFIRVVSDSFGNEIERYVVVKDDGIQSTEIEGTAGDKISFTFSFRTAVAQSFPATLVFIVQITDGTTTKYADEDGSWNNPGGYSQVFNSDLTQWQTVELKTGRLPFDGLVRVFLRPHTSNPADETHFNDLRFEYNAYINESTRITGHTHTDTQDINIKNKNETDIHVDDSPRNFVSGTLFLDSLTGLIQTRTSSWSLPSLTSVQSCKLFHFQVFGPSDPYTITGQYCDGSPINISGMGSGGNPAPICGRPGTIVTTGCQIVQQNEDCGTYTPDVIPRRLGEIVTHEVKQWRSMPRTITEGTLHGDVLVSPMTTFTSPIFPNLKFVPGKMAIDYANKTCTGTLHELYATGEPVVASDYDFEYIYDTK